MKSFHISYKASAKLLLLFVLASLMFSGCNKTPENPQLSLSADTLIFRGNERQSLYITTSSPERRQLYVDYPYWWIWMDYDDPSIVEGDTVELKIKSRLNDFHVPQEGSLYIACAYDDKVVVLIGLPEGCDLHFVPDTLFFPLDVDGLTMTIGNYGDTPMDYSITASSSNVSFSPASGRVPKMQHADIAVTINRENLFAEPNPKLYVTLDDRVDSVLIIPEKKVMLPNNVVDAEYSKATNLLVYVSSDSKLNIYRPDTRTISSVALSYEPVCVSVSPDGTKAVVGHNAHVTYVDLMAETVLTTNDISCGTYDIVLTDSGWTYVFPEYYQSPHIRCIDVSTENAIETLSTGNIISTDVKAKLHPSGRYIYGADNGSSSCDMEKYDIQDGTARYLYQTPPYSFNLYGDLWFQENGEKIFTRGGVVLQTSNLQGSDMVKVGDITLEGNYTRIKWLDQLDLKKEFYLVLQNEVYWYGDAGTTPPYVYVYDSDDLSYKTKIKLEDYWLNFEGYGYQSFVSEPYFVFVNPEGTQLYVITKSTYQDLPEAWAIQTIILE